MLLLLLFIPLFLSSLSLFLNVLSLHPSPSSLYSNPYPYNASPHAPPLSFIPLDLSSPLWNGEQDLKLQNAATGVLHLQCLVMLDLGVIHYIPVRHFKVKVKLKILEMGGICTMQWQGKY